MKIKIIFLLLTVLFQTNIAISQEKPVIPEIDRIRIAEAFNVADKIGDGIWKDWHKVPFSILLITPDYEFLIRHPNPSNDFTFISYDSLLKSKIYFRKRINSTNLTACFPVNGLSTVVVGQPENTTSKTSTPWVVMLLHEHFHQLQHSLPGHDSDVNSLHLSRGDKTGMWMLNFSFPYDSIELIKKFSSLCKKLSDTINSTGSEQFKIKLSEYLKRREEFKNMLTPDDYKYFSFQLWTEGIAMYTEYNIAKSAAEKYSPGKEFKALNDYTPFSDYAAFKLKNILTELPNLPLNKYRRVAFYYLGAGEAILLDSVNPGWKELYLKEKFFMNKYFQ